MAAKVLFVGGTGIISSACSPRALEHGHDLYLFNRGRSLRPSPADAVLVPGDIHANPQVLQEVIDEHHIDVVVNWIAFHPDDVRRDIELLRGRVGQYIFISSASAYQKPVPSLPITEATPLGNPYWEYSRNKQRCEEILMEAYQREGFPVTVVRPSHTYDRTLLPFSQGYTILRRMLAGKPVIVHGDGTSLWVLTHHRDFARAFVELLGNPAAIGEAYHITSDEVLTWNRIYSVVAESAGVELRSVHIASEAISRYDADWGASLLGDKAHSVMFDNSKIREVASEFKAEVPFEEGVQEIVAWYEQNEGLYEANPDFDALQDRIINDLGRPS